MLDVVTAAAAGVAGYRLVRGWLAPAEEEPVVPVAPPPPPTKRRRGKPHAASMPLFTPYRGAHLTTAAAVRAAMLADPGPLYELANILWPARKYLNKLTFVTGRPGSGKTTMQRLCMASVGRLFPALLMRWFVIDPTNAYLHYLYQTLPEDVEIVRASPHDAAGWRWDVAADVTSESLNEALQTALLPDALFKKAGDPFWMTKAREVSQGVVNVYHDRGSDWRFSDLVIPIKYPQYLKPLLLQSPRTAGKVKHELVGRLGRDIVSTGSSVINRMATAAAQWQRATKSFSLSDFLDRTKTVLHFSFTPVNMASLSAIANAMSYLLILLGLERDDELNHTVCWFDEGRFLDGITGIELLGARGRGSGFGAFVSCQTVKGLMATWGRERVEELLELVATWITFSAGYETARAFSNAVGQIEGLEKSYGHSTTTTRSSSVTEGGGSSWSSRGGTTRSSNRSVTSGYSTSSSYSENFKLTVKDAVLPSEVTNLPLADPETDTLAGIVFNPDTGVFHFESPFLGHFESLDPPPFSGMPVRDKDSQILKPWGADDLLRLNLEMSPEFMKALRTTWGHTGGVK